MCSGLFFHFCKSGVSGTVASFRPVLFPSSPPRPQLSQGAFPLGKGFAHANSVQTLCVCLNLCQLCDCRRAGVRAPVGIMAGWGASFWQTPLQSCAFRPRLSRLRKYGFLHDLASFTTARKLFPGIRLMEVSLWPVEYPPPQCRPRFEKRIPATRRSGVSLYLVACRCIGDGQESAPEGVGGARFGHLRGQSSGESWPPAVEMPTPGLVGLCVLVLARRAPAVGGRGPRSPGASKH